MFIRYIKLHKFKRFGTGNITTFEWTPESNLMVILGANGSGKSSLVHELTPLPSRHVNFNKDGIKEFKCSHGAFEYHLVSNYSGVGTGKHSFLRNGEELNSGGTFKVQEELCLQEFGITREIHDIAIGRIKFTELTTARRRDLLTRMSPVDLDYAFKIYDSVRQEHRSQRGVMDLISKRLVSENHDIPTDNEITLLKEESERLSNRLTSLFNERVVCKDKPFNNSEDPKTEFENILNRTKVLLKEYIQIPEFIEAKSDEDLAKLQTELNGLRHNNNQLINRLVEELEKLKKLDDTDFENIELEIKTLTKDNDELKNIIQSKTNVVDNYKGEFPLINENNDSITDLNNLENMFKLWHELLVTFPVNPDHYFGREKALKETENNKVLKAELTRLEEELVLVKTRVKNIRECEPIECPKCNHGFKPGVTEADIKTLKDRGEFIPNRISELEDLIKVSDSYLEEFDNYYSFVLRYSRLTREYPSFQKLWDYNTQQNVMFVEPAKYVTKAINWFEASKALIELKLKEFQYVQNRKRIDNLTQMDVNTIKYVNERKESLHGEIDKLYTENNDLNTKINNLSLVKVNIKAKVDDIESLLVDYNRWRSNCVKYRDYLLMQAYNSEIQDLQIKLADTTKNLNTLEQRETTIKTLEGEVSRAKDSFDDLGLLIKAMSPNNGLIGQYLLTFMQGVVSLVNAYINEIWTHSLEVLPSRIDRDELNYNFPIFVADGAVVTNDISEGSESQVDVINFAFRLTILKLLKVTELPLFLDEFGRTFDEQHRANLIPFITNLIDNGLFKQIFYVSHLEGTHGAFNLAEFVVINGDNITVPEVYNTNVEIR